MSGLLCCDLSLRTIEENLACDEALLEWCESEPGREILRFWEPSDTSVVLGYANAAAAEVNLEYCAAAGIPVLRRCSGGGTVLQGVGCLNYAVVLTVEPGGPLSGIHSTNEYVMERNRGALAALTNQPIERRGHTDLAIRGVKFSGNAQRRKRRCLLFHGTFLLSMDLGLVEHALKMPSQEPEYREGRRHLEFIMNLGAEARAVKAVLREAWKVTAELSSYPESATAELVRTRYSRPDWNLKF